MRKFRSEIFLSDKMMKVRTDVMQKTCNMMLLFVIILSYSVAFAEEALTTDNPQACDPKCGCDPECACDEMFTYDAAADMCRINFHKVMKRVVVIYDKHNTDVLTEDGMAKAIFLEGEKIFKGILISVILIMACASVCVAAACIYCCRINYTDKTLKKDVKAVAKKLKANYNSNNVAPKRTPLPAISETCSVVVEPAGVFVA